MYQTIGSVRYSGCSGNATRWRTASAYVGDRRAAAIQSLVDDEIAVVVERELALLAPEVRGSADQLEELLDPEFGEIASRDVCGRAVT
jgi:hypothetical protein